MMCEFPFYFLIRDASWFASKDNSTSFTHQSFLQGLVISTACVKNIKSVLWLQGAALKSAQLPPVMSLESASFSWCELEVSVSDLCSPASDLRLH